MNEQNELYRGISMNAEFEDMSLKEKAYDTLQRCGFYKKDAINGWFGISQKAIENSLKEYNRILDEPLDHIQERAKALFFLASGKLNEPSDYFFQAQKISIGKDITKLNEYTFTNEEDILSTLYDYFKQKGFEEHEFDGIKLAEMITFGNEFDIGQNIKTGWEIYYTDDHKILIFWDYIIMGLISDMYCLIRTADFAIVDELPKPLSIITGTNSMAPQIPKKLIDKSNYCLKHFIIQNKNIKKRKDN